MNKTLKRMITLALALLLIGGGIGAFFGYRGHQTREQLLAVALEDAGLERAEVYDVDLERERERGRTWYEVSFETFDTEYEYRIDAASGQILDRNSEANF